MNLLTQIQVLSYSFLFGLYFSFTFNLLYKVLFTKYLILNIITNLIYFLGNSFLYFYLLYKINNGISIKADKIVKINEKPIVNSIHIIKLIIKIIK